MGGTRRARDCSAGSVDVAAFPAQAAGDAFTVEIPPERIGDPEPELVIGLPPALDVWLVETNGNEGSLGMLWPTLADLTMSVPSHEEVLDDWLVSWTRAQEVGIGRRVFAANGMHSADHRVAVCLRYWRGPSGRAFSLAR